LGNATVGTPFGPSVITATGGVAPYSWSARIDKIDPLPPKGTPSSTISINSRSDASASLTANFTSPGNYTLSVTAKGANGAQSPEALYKVTVARVSRPVIAPANGTLANGTVSMPYGPITFQVTSGTPPYSWSANLTTPADGSAVQITPFGTGNASASFSGNFTKATTYDLEIVVADSKSIRTTGKYKIPVNSLGAAPKPRTATLPVAVIGSPYSSFTFNATGGVLPLTWASVPNPPAAGMTLSENGVLSGTPTEVSGITYPQTIPLNVTATDKISRSGSANYTLTIVKALAIDGPATIIGQQYQTISPAQFSASGGTGNYTWTTTPKLPASLSINTTSGVISGNLSAAPGNYPVTVTVRDGGNQTASRNCTITIQNAPSFAWVTEQILPSGKVGTSYSTNLTVTGGRPSYTYVLKNGSALPEGLTLNSTTGRISGTPKKASLRADVIVSTLAGSGIQGHANGQGSEASFYAPFGVAIDFNGNLYVVDYGANKIKKIDPNGNVSNLAGSGNVSSIDGFGVAVGFAFPRGVAVDGNGSVFVADSSNHSIRKIAADSNVTTLAGISDGIGGYLDAQGREAKFNYPTDVAIDVNGNLFVADANNNLIRKISTNGNVTTLAGSGISGNADGPGASANFNKPWGVAVDGSGNVYVADSGNNRIRKITANGTVTTLAGSGSATFTDGIGASASFNTPTGVAVDGGGNVYVADSENNRIRKISLSGEVTTLAGSGNGYYVDGLGAAASFKGPIGVAVDGNGSVYVTDSGNYRIRKITPTTSGSDKFTIIARDSANPQNTAEREFTLSIASYGMTVSGPDSASGSQFSTLAPAQFAVTGGVAAYRWSATGLPASLSINSSTGLVSGNLTGAPGNYTANITVRDGKSQTASKNFTITIGSLAPLVATGPASMSGERYQTISPAQFSATGGAGNYTWSTNPKLPASLSINTTTGLITGNLTTTPGTYPVTVIVKDRGNQTASINCTVTIVAPTAPAVSGPSAITGQRYQAISPSQFSVAGGVAPYTWSTAPALPSSLSINATTGVITGNLTAAPGNYTVAVTAKDKVNQTATRNCTITILALPPLVVTGPGSITGERYQPIAPAQFNISVGVPPFTWSTTPALPASLSINATTGVISGNLTAAPGNYTVAVTAKDKVNQSATQNCTITILPPPPLAVTGPANITGERYQAISPAQFSVTGGVAPFTWSTSPSLPSSLSINATTGMISGNLSAAPGNYTVAVTAKDKVNQSVTRNCTITILAPGPLTITTDSDLGFVGLSQNFTAKLQATGGRPPYTWSFVSRGNLPPSANLTASGNLTANSSTELTANFTVMVKDTLGANATKAMTLRFVNSDVIDSDGDGVNNYREMYDGTNPFDAKSFNSLSIGLVAHYPFEGNAVDESGYKNDGDVKGAVLTSDQYGNQSSAYELNGTNNFIDIPNSLGNSEVGTISIWFKAKNWNHNTKGRYLFSITQSPALSITTESAPAGSGDWINLGVHTNSTGNNNLVFGVWADSGWRWADSADSARTDQWQNVVGIFDKDIISIFINGIKKGEIPNDGYPVSAARKFIIGASAWSGTSFNGKIDEVRIYNRALTAAEVSQLYSEESGEPNMVLVQGGTLPAGSALANQTVSAFHIARFETTWSEWKQVRTWAVANGYTDLANVGQGSADNHPVRNVSWYDTVKWLNAKSQMEGFMPVYSVNGTTYKTGQSIPTLLATANGYRLPAEAEWERAARGGVSSLGYAYSGSNDINAVAWYSLNSGNGTKAIGTKLPNEQGLYDMSGNISEWCWDENAISGRRMRGGGWLSNTDFCSVSYRHTSGIGTREIHFGFRFARSAIGDMVTVQGGTLPGSYGLTEQGVQAFQIGRTEVTWDEWQTVRTWAASNGYTDLAGVGQGSAANHPVRNVSWYDVVKWSNAKSQMEGLAPVYSVNGTVYKNGIFVPTPSSTANGYRLPGEAEWEWAARGGIVSKGYSYSGGNNLAEVGWYRGNSEGALVDLSSLFANSKAGTGTWPVAQKKPNELGLFDMSGNISEWCWDKGNPDSSQIGGYQRHLRGPSWFNDTIEASIIHRTPYGDPAARSARTGFRLARNIGPKISISGTLPEATLNQAYAGYTFGVVGSTADKVWSISEGALPLGMSFSANGTLSGTPTTAGTYTFVIHLESGGYWDEVEVELEVVASINYAEMVTVQGGTLPVGSGLAGQKVSTFQIGKYEVTWGEWKEVRDWAVTNGYGDLVNVGSAAAATAPAEGARWYDIIKWCNAKSEMHGRTPVYQIGGVTYRNGEIAPTVNKLANGYRLPTEIEWEWAARGGNISKSFLYSGGNELDVVGFYYANSPPEASSVGLKLPNELGIYDMSGNVWEWCEELSNESNRRLRGGGFASNESDCAVSSRGIIRSPSLRVPFHFGFRLALNAAPNYAEMITVQGGTLPAGSGLAGQQVSSFQVGKYEVTLGEWRTVRDWAVANGYTDLDGVGEGSEETTDSHPVRYVSWYDAVKWCNARSEREGFTPVYRVSGAVYRAGEAAPTVNSAANGYRLPSESEWEWAARGGLNSQGYTYSGSNDVNAVAWHAVGEPPLVEYGNGPQPVGLKIANELGIHDMSGNEWEWCWDSRSNTPAPDRRLRGGSWMSIAAYCTVARRERVNSWDANANYAAPHTRGPGFRLVRNSGN
jgi:formylglycine-generating enzyme required for sulfatase activity